MSLAVSRNVESNIDELHEEDKRGFQNVTGSDLSAPAELMRVDNWLLIALLMLSSLKFLFCRSDLDLTAVTLPKGSTKIPNLNVKAAQDEKAS